MSITKPNCRTETRSISPLPSYQCTPPNSNTRLIVHQEKNIEEAKQTQNDEEDVVKCCLMGVSQDLLKGEQWIQSKIKVNLIPSSLLPLCSSPPSTILLLTSPPISSPFTVTIIYMQEMTSTDMVTFEHHIPAAVARELSAIKKKYGVTIQSEKCKVCLGGRGKEGKRTRRRARILTANI